MEPNAATVQPSALKAIDPRERNAVPHAVSDHFVRVLVDAHASPSEDAHATRCLSSAGLVGEA